MRLAVTAIVVSLSLITLYEVGTGVLHVFNHLAAVLAVPSA